MTHHEYQTSGTCSRLMSFDLDDNHLIHNLTILGGCNGNLQGIARLVEGQKAEEVINKLQGVRCGSKVTSCPDQLTKALVIALKK